MNEDELSSIIDREIANSVGFYDGKLADQRKKSMDYYLGEPFGNEVEGRSQFVSRDVADTIEGILPSLLKIFTASEEIVKFEPQGQEDEQGSSQATDYTNYVFNRQNNGFVVLYTWFKDALLQKNGFVKVYWDSYTKRKVEEYSNLNPDEVAQLFLQLQQEGEVEIEQEGENFKFICKGKYGKVCIDPVPPEEIRVNRNAKWDLQKERFVCHERRLSASDLREMGYDVEDLEPYPGDDFNMERHTRFRYDQEETWDDDTGQEANREYLIRECYILVDFDGDGIAERRQVLISGKKVLDNVEIDRVPIVSITPILMPHKLFGLSVADLVSDLQLLKSTLLRQILDNMYLTNNSRMMALDGMVNIDDLLTVRPGGIVRVKTFDAVKPLQIPFFGAPAFTMLEYVDGIRENRTGVTRYNQGLDADSLNKTATGINNIMNAAQQRIELIARIFAETGVKELMWSIFMLLSKHERKEKLIRLRNHWVPIDPRGWSTKYDMTVTVGLGTGSKDQLLNGAALVGQFQEKIAPMFPNIVGPQQIYNLAKEVAGAVMPKKADMFFSDPSQSPPPPEKVDPKVEVAKYKADLQDKVKRDVESSRFMLEVARLSQESGKSADEMDMQDEERGFKERESEAMRSMQMDQKRMDHDMERERFSNETKIQGGEAALRASENLDMLIQNQQQLILSQQQLLESMRQMAAVMSAPKRIITDERGEPVGVEPVLSQEPALSQEPVL